MRVQYLHGTQTTSDQAVTECIKQVELLYVYVTEWIAKNRSDLP